MRNQSFNISGLLLLIDLVNERGLSKADIIWGDSNECRFPLFDGLIKLSLKGMCAVYAVMFFSKLSILFNIKFFKLKIK
jgi:vitamin K-dependent gamma-carboxylase